MSDTAAPPPPPHNLHVTLRIPDDAAHMSLVSALKRIDELERELREALEFIEMKLNGERGL